MIADRVIQRDAAVGLFHVLDAPDTEAVEHIVADLHSRRQFEQQTTDAVFRILYRTAQNEHQRGRQEAVASYPEM